MSDHQLGDGPAEDAGLMTRLSRAVNQILNGSAKPKRRHRNGFVIMVFPFDGAPGRCNYSSNAKREDIVVLLREQLRRFEDYYREDA